MLAERGREEQLIAVALVRAFEMIMLDELSYQLADWADNVRKGCLRGDRKVNCAIANILRQNPVQLTSRLTNRFAVPALMPALDLPLALSS